MTAEYNVEPKEEFLWQRVKNRSRPGESVRVLPIAKNIGLHHETAKQFVRKWKNEGLVKRSNGGDSDVVVVLSKEGRELSSLEDINDAN